MQIPYKCKHDLPQTNDLLQSLAFSKFKPSVKVLWDVGAGTGRVGIEWLKLHPDCTVIGMERDQECIATMHENAIAHGTPQLYIEPIDVTKDLSNLTKPDAIYLGCASWNQVNLCKTLWEYLMPGGTIVTFASQAQGLLHVQQALMAGIGSSKQINAGSRTTMDKTQFWSATKPM